MICLVERPEMEWDSRFTYLSAKREVRQVELYGMDLLWKLVKAKYDGDIPMPSEVWDNRNKIDRRSAKQIIQDTINKLGGE